MNIREYLPSVKQVVQWLVISAIVTFVINMVGGKAAGWLNDPLGQIFGKSDGQS